ncbi:MAG: phosphodiesterase [Pontimonas sp.]|nr:phosphodiesterase [Pontimonas sp.]
MTAFSQHPPADHILVHLSDTHFLGSGRKLYDQIDSDGPLRQLMERLHASDMTIDALVFTGDLADRAEADAYERLRDLIEPWAQKLDAELIWVMGNHDEREPFTEILWREDPTMETRDRVVMLGDLRLIVVDSTVPGYHHGEITEAQRTWLREELATPAPHGTLLALHHPPIPTPIDLMGLIELDDQAALADVVRGTDVRGILAGHLHYSTFSTFAGVPVSVSAASCYNIDLVADSAKILSAKADSLSASLVHVYPDRVVFSLVPMDDTVELASYEASYRSLIQSMSPQERREMFSNKNSEFNRQSDEQQSGF